jgi:glycosyltransferase involved in cell wall biosynthesis
VVVVDDGSTDPGSLAVLDRIAATEGCTVLHQPNRGVSAARNAGIAAVADPLVVVLDGDDRLAPTFLARTTALLSPDPTVVAASSWLRMHGVLDAVVRPAGGSAVDFLHRNACPATLLLRRDAWERAGGYDESMREGFEDWDLALRLLTPGGRIAVVPEPLIDYRTAPASANVRSMTQRVERFAGIVDRHRPLYERHLREVLLAQEARAVRSDGLREDLLVRHPEEPLGEVTYGDGGMAAAVRITGRRSARAGDADGSAPAG